MSDVADPGMTTLERLVYMANQIARNFEAIGHDAALAGYFLLKLVVSPVVFQGYRTGQKGQVIAAEGTAVLARLPGIELGGEHDDSHRQTGTGN